jgi:hypothetical protein
MKLRYFYKIDHKKQPIPGSNVRRKSRPGASHQWKEILDPCCEPATVPCTCGPRFFIQLDNKGKPVDGSLMKRFSLPEGTSGMKFYEVAWKSPCCNFITWSFEISETTGSFVIEVNGVEVVNDIIGGVNSTGTFKLNPGDTVEVTLTNTGSGILSNSLQITGGETFSSTTSPVTTHSFEWNGQETNISGVISAEEE